MKPPQGLSFERERRKTRTKSCTEIGLRNCVFSVLQTKMFFALYCLPDIFRFNCVILSKKNVDGRSTSSHDNMKCGTRSMEKQRGMAFGFQKTATAVIKPDKCMHYACHRNKLIPH
jgi:hypothetical protein